MEHHHRGTFLPLRHLAEFWRPMPTTFLDRLRYGLGRRGVTFLRPGLTGRLDQRNLRPLTGL